LRPQDNFGYDLPAVEAAMKKHEAIEADISSYQERIQVVVELALEMESEGYYDSRRIGAQRDNILRQWGLLTELLAARRARLEQNLALQKIFQEMVYMIDWMEEVQALLLSKDTGKHLLEVEDLLQKQALLEADVAAQSERVQALNAAALAFAEREELAARKGPGAARVQEKLRAVRLRWKKLEEATGLHQQRLQEALNLVQFNADTDDLVAWLQDAYRLVSSDDFGHDDYSTQALARKHRAVLEELEQHRGAVLALRRELGRLAPAQRQAVEVQIRVVEVEQLYGEVAEVAVLRRQWLQDALAVYRMFAEVHACEGWLDDKEQWLRRVEVPEELDEVEV
ncbi:SPTB2 protein, partial [Eudromia elegans]|nr:SPTB2 protein [Eudromia elegans]